MVRGSPVIFKSDSIVGSYDVTGRLVVVGDGQASKQDWSTEMVTTS